MHLYFLFTILVCWLPIGQYFVGYNDTDIALCQSEEMVRFALKVLYHISERSVKQKETRCLRRCQQTEWEVEVTKEMNPAHMDGTAVIFLDSAMDSKHIEDVVIFDFNAVVASVGGSLGLFLGVSFLSLLTALGKVLPWRRLNKSKSRRKEKERERRKKKENTNVIVI